MSTNKRLNIGGKDTTVTYKRQERLSVTNKRTETQGASLFLYVFFSACPLFNNFAGCHEDQLFAGFMLVYNASTFPVGS